MAGRQTHGLQRQLKAAAVVAVQRHRRGEGPLYCTYWHARHPQQPGGRPLEGVGHPISSRTPMSVHPLLWVECRPQRSTGNMHPGTKVTGTAEILKRARAEH